MSNENSSSINKARYWVAVCYQENMRDDWRESISELVQVPFAYCEHDKDTDSQSEHRTDHVHIILAFSNTTTYKHALSVFSLLNADGKKSVNTCFAVLNIRRMYNYLIHDTDDCKKKNKHLYAAAERITGNGFDIGSYEQLSISEKNDILRDLCNLIIREGFTNFADFYLYVMNYYEDSNYFDLLKSYSGLLERLTKANWQKQFYGSSE